MVIFRENFLFRRKFAKRIGCIIKLNNVYIQNSPFKSSVITRPRECNFAAVYECEKEKRIFPVAHQISNIKGLKFATLNQKGSIHLLNIVNEKIF